MAGLYLNHVKVAEESGGEITVPGTVNHESLKVGGVEVLSSSGTANLVSPTITSPNITSPTFSGNPLNLYSGNLSPFVKTQWNMNLQSANPIDWHTHDFANEGIGNYKILFGPNYLPGDWKFGVEFSSVARVWGCIIQPINTAARPQYLKIFHGGEDGASEIQAPARPVMRFSGHGFGTDSPTSSHNGLTTNFLEFENTDRAHMATWEPVNSKYWLANFGSSVYNNGNANAGIQNFQWLGTILT